MFADQKRLHIDDNCVAKPGDITAFIINLLKERNTYETIYV